MYIVLSDHQDLMSQNERQQLYDRVLFSMARFAHRINSVRVYVSCDPTDAGDAPTCVITTSVEDSGLVTVAQSADTLMTAVCLAIDALEPEVACRIGCRHSYRSRAVNARHLSIGDTLMQLFGMRKRSFAA